MRKSREFFICQQGFAVPNANPHLYSALMLQPRIIGSLVVLGSILQRPELFLVLGAVLAWGAFVPTQNVFDAVYNHAVASPRGFPPLGAAPAPRRFAQGGAAMLALAIGIAMTAGAAMTARILEGVFVAGVASAVLRRFCLPAALYYVLRRRLLPISSPAGASASPQC
jgi:hypothetical protein